MGHWILPKSMRKTLRICLHCGEREYGFKNKSKFKELIQEFRDGKRENNI